MFEFEGVAVWGGGVLMLVGGPVVMDCRFKVS